MLTFTVLQYFLIMSSSNQDLAVDMEGILEKKGPTSIQSYKKRKCVLSGKLMRYYDDNSLKNEIDLHSMVDVEMGHSELPGNKHHLFVKKNQSS